MVGQLNKFKELLESQTAKTQTKKFKYYPLPHIFLCNSDKHNWAESFPYTQHTDHDFRAVMMS